MLRWFLTCAFYPMSLAAALVAGMTLLSASVAPMVAVGSTAWPRLHRQGLGLPDGTRVDNSY